MPPSTAPTRNAARTQTTGTAEVARQAGRDAADDRVLRVAHRAAYVARQLARHVVRGQGGGHDASIVAERHAPDHEEEPRPTPDSGPGEPAGIRGLPDGVRRAWWRTVVP